MILLIDNYDSFTYNLYQYMEMCIRDRFDSLHFPLFHYFTKEQMLRTRGAIQALQRLEWFQLTDESLQQLFLYILFLTRHADSENTEKPVAVQEDFINTQ